MNHQERNQVMQNIFDIYWFIKKRIRLFFWLTTTVLTLGIGIFIYFKSLSFDYIWISFIIGPGIMLLTFIGYKIQRYEDKHGLTHHKSYNGTYIHTTFPMKKEKNE